MLSILKCETNRTYMTKRIIQKKATHEHNSKYDERVSCAAANLKSKYHAQNNGLRSKLTRTSRIEELNKKLLTSTTRSSLRRRLKGRRPHIEWSNINRKNYYTKDNGSSAEQHSWAQRRRLKGRRPCCEATIQPNIIKQRIVKQN